MDTTENNKKLAEFIEANKGIKTLFYLPQFGHYQNSNGQIDYVEVFREEELKFHNDWNWLMEVVEKIRGLEVVENFNINVTNDVIIEGLFPTIQTDCTNKIGTIEAVYNACVEFVEWRNKKQIIGREE